MMFTLLKYEFGSLGPDLDGGIIHLYKVSFPSIVVFPVCADEFTIVKG